MSDGPHGGPNQRNGKGEFDALPSMVVHHLPPPRVLFKTPTAQLGRNGAAQHPDKRKAGGHGPTLDDEVVYLLPTPTAADSRSTANLRSDGTAYRDGYGPTLTDAVRHFLPTPTTSDGKGGPGTSPNRKGGMNLRTAVSTLPEPEGKLVQDWGKYEPAIRRQEAWMGRPAPLPTEVGPRGGRRLTARFAEWLMGLPDGWVTDTPGLSRADQLHAIGNGVVPRQAHAAFAQLLADVDTTH